PVAGSKRQEGDGAGPGRQRGQYYQQRGQSRELVRAAGSRDLLRAHPSTSSPRPTGHDQTRPMVVDRPGGTEKWSTGAQAAALRGPRPEQGPAAGDRQGEQVGRRDPAESASPGRGGEGAGDAGAPGRPPRRGRGVETDRPRLRVA